MVYQEGRHFVLHLLKFVFQILGRHFPANMQKLLAEFPIDEESKFSTPITKAIMVFVNEYMDYGANLADISSHEFQEALNSVKQHEEFLEFLGYYAVKCVSEYKTQRDSPTIFLGSVTNFLRNIREMEGTCMLEYWEELDRAAARIVVRDLEIYKGSDQQLRDPNFVINMALERKFIIDVINYILGLFGVPEDIKLKHEENPESTLTSNIKNALQIAVDHQAQRFLLLRDYDPMNQYFHNASTKGFSEEYFLEYCVCCTRQAVSEYNKNNNVEAPKVACNHLETVLLRAKENGKFTTLERMDEAAVKLIQIDFERKAHKRERNSVFKRKLESDEGSSKPEEKHKKDEN